MLVTEAPFSGNGNWTVDRNGTSNGNCGHCRFRSKLGSDSIFISSTQTPVSVTFAAPGSASEIALGAWM